MFSTAKKCKYDEKYIKFGFTSLEKDGIDLPQCVLCLKTFGNGSMKPFQLEQHLEKSHGEHVNKPVAYFKCKEDVFKRSRLDNAGAFFQNTQSIVEASYAVSLQITKLKKPHKISETLVKPCLLKCAKLVLGDTAYKKLKQVSLSTDTTQRRIAEMSDDIKTQLFSSLRSSQFAF